MLIVSATRLKCRKTMTGTTDPPHRTGSRSRSGPVRRRAPVPDGATPIRRDQTT